MVDGLGWLGDSGTQTLLEQERPAWVFMELSSQLRGEAQRRRGSLEAMRNKAASSGCKAGE